jgi:[ribosomal protein S5]-alanine N-acetyltransferase
VSSQSQSRDLRQMVDLDEVLETERLLLIGVTLETLEAELRGQALGEVVPATVPASWPPPYWDANAIAYLLERMRRVPEARGWCRYIALKQAGGAPPMLIGSCGCTEPPETVEDVEIGYSILAEYQRRGLVTEAIRRFLPWIFGHSNVHSVCAQTYPQLAGSIGVLRKCGFVLDGTGKDPGTVLFRLQKV